MKVLIQSVGFTAQSTLLSKIDAKVSKKLTRIDANISEAQVYLRVENAQSSRKVCEIKVNMKGSSLFASKSADSFEEATDEALDAIRSQILRKKELS